MTSLPALPAASPVPAGVSPRARALSSRPLRRSLRGCRLGIPGWPPGRSQLRFRRSLAWTHRPQTCCQTMRGVDSDSRGRPQGPVTGFIAWIRLAQSAGSGRIFGRVKYSMSLPHPLRRMRMRPCLAMAAYLSIDLCCGMALLVNPLDTDPDAPCPTNMHLLVLRVSMRLTITGVTNLS